MRRPSLPALFVSHGAPSLPIDDIPARDFLRRLGENMPRPRAIVAISAHTIAQGAVVVGSAPQLHAVHDFGGFPDALYQLRYDPPGDVALAAQVAERLRQAGVGPIQEVPIEGLDHGIWVPLSLMFPQADIPVVVVSLDGARDARGHMAIGEALRGLGWDGVLVMGTGSVTHNLRDVFSRTMDAPVEPYAREFAQWVDHAVLTGDRQALIQWETLAPHASRSHPTTEHFLPLLVAAGAGPGGCVLHQSFTFGVLGMHAYAFD